MGVYVVAQAARIRSPGPLPQKLPSILTPLPRLMPKPLGQRDCAAGGLGATDGVCRPESYALHLRLSPHSEAQRGSPEPIIPLAEALGTCPVLGGWHGRAMASPLPRQDWGPKAVPLGTPGTELKQTWQSRQSLESGGWERALNSSINQTSPAEPAGDAGAEAGKRRR